MLLLNWMGYEGKYFSPKRRFLELLENYKIPYEEI
jgi:hypothetical protein